MKDIDNDAIFLLKEAVETKMGFSLKAPTNFDALITCVRNSTNETLSMSTIKRLWGYVNQSSSPRLSTLSILSRFLGFRDFDDFCAKQNNYTIADSEFIDKAAGQVKNLRIGDELILEWKPDRYCKLRYEDDDLFVVLSAIHCKLKKNDRFRASFIALGHPLYASELMRDGVCLNDYVAGKASGIQSISIKHARKRKEE